MKKVSVAMAVYNGEKYLQQQIDSIVLQLGTQDELVISYNESIDNTYAIINRYKKEYKNIKVVKCGQKGVISNFNNAIQNCTGDVIFLADQDDVWLPTKISKVLDCMYVNGVDLVVHDCDIVDSDLISYGKSLFGVRNAHSGKIYNLCKNCYQGSCIAFKSDFVNKICPIPNDIAMHDQWIGMVMESCGKVFFLKEKLILYRRHEETVSNGRIKLDKKVLYMIRMIKRLKQRLGERCDL